MEKIQQALDLCDSSLQEFFTELDKALPNEKERELFKHHILTKTYFAGGVFRSIFTKNDVNDLDIFFEDDDSALLFAHTVMSNNNLSSLFTKTDLYTFNYKKLSFITNNTGKPSVVLDSFDVTLNMHYYKYFSKEMRFNKSSFDKRGVVNINCPDYHTNPIRLFKRVLRFVQEGFNIPEAYIEDLLRRVMFFKRTPENIETIQQLSRENPGSSSSNKVYKPITEDYFAYYTHTDYFQTINNKLDSTEYKIESVTVPIQRSNTGQVRVTREDIERIFPETNQFENMVNNQANAINNSDITWDTRTWTRTIRTMPIPTHPDDDRQED